MGLPRRAATRRIVRAALGFGVVVMATAGAPEVHAGSQYPPSETIVTSPVNTPPTPTSVASTGANGIDTTLASGLAFGVAGLGMLVVARRRRQPAH